ncbi:MAG TPA: DbpA RNA binding domain-containing protein [Gemmatimonadales bacterium]
MSGFLEWQMAPAVAAGLERLGWQASDPEVRDVVPAVVRGNNLVAVLPPVPAWAIPIVAALLGRTDAAGQVLILVAPAQLDEWTTAVGALIEGSSLKVEVLRPGATPRRAAEPVDLAIASPATALAQHAQSSLHPDRFRAILFAWPESWQADEAVSALLQDCPRDAQRLVVTVRQDQINGADGVVERYARKAIVVPAATVVPVEGKPAAAIRSVPTSWSGRAATVAAIASRAGEAPVTIWTADNRDHQQIRRALGSLPSGWTIASRSIPGTGDSVCYDLPAPAQLARLGHAGAVTLLVPPGCESYVESAAPVRQPIQATSPLRAVVDRDESIRAEIARAATAGADAGALYAVGPLFERFDPQIVAATLYSMWQRARQSTDASTSRVSPAQGSAGAPAPTGVTSGGTGIAKLWISAGRKDEATIADFVAVLIREARMDRAQIGRIDLRDTFALVEVPAADAEAIAQRLIGVTIRKRKVSARVDLGRGPKGSGDRPSRR